jgi:hypothetical protein
MKRPANAGAGSEQDLLDKEELESHRNPTGADGGRTIYDEESYSEARINEHAESGSDTYGRKADDVEQEEDEAGNRSYWTDLGKDRA